MKIKRKLICGLPAPMFCVLLVTFAASLAALGAACFAFRAAEPVSAEKTVLAETISSSETVSSETVLPEASPSSETVTPGTIPSLETVTPGASPSSETVTPGTSPSSETVLSGANPSSETVTSGTNPSSETSLPETSSSSETALSETIPSEESFSEPPSSGGQASNGTVSESDVIQTDLSKTDPLEKEVETLLHSMTAEQKVSQLFFVSPEALSGVSPVTQTGEKMKAGFRAHPPGGIIYFAPNLVSEKQTREMLAEMQSFALQTEGFPVFLGVDEEGGRVLRVGGNPGFSIKKEKSAKELAEEGEDAVFAAGENIGSYLSDLGFNLDFAPDADVLTNPANKVIGPRSFGSDPAEVSRLAWCFSEGLRKQGVIPCYKHFPGHGGTAEDTHEGYAYSYKTLEELYQGELVPFADGSSKGIEMIMASHISLPAIHNNDTPASLSQYMITGVLRKGIGYQGVIITDALDMGAVSSHYASGEAAVLALQAGCDMLLMASHYEEAYQAVLKATQDGRISQERIDESVRRILRLKRSSIIF